jgi:Integrase core domain
MRDRSVSARSPWQNGYAERLIGSIRRECLDHVVVVGERHLRHVLASYQKYYNEVRTHVSLQKDAPVRRDVCRTGRVRSSPILGGLHHQYVRVEFPTGTGSRSDSALRTRSPWRANLPADPKEPAPGSSGAGFLFAHDALPSHLPVRAAREIVPIPSIGAFSPAPSVKGSADNEFCSSRYTPKIVNFQTGFSRTYPHSTR